MKRFALLVFCVLASGCIAQRCGNTPAFTPETASIEFRAGASSVPTLSIRLTADAAEIFKDRYITIHNDYGQVIGTTDVSQMVEIGQNFIAALEGDYARLENSIKQTPNKSVRSTRIDKDLKQMNEQLETFLKLKPGTQKVKSNLRDMPPKPEFKSDNKNLTASQAFLHLAETIDGEWYEVGQYANALHWYGWRRVRTFFDLLQTQIRNQILNGQVLPVYRRIVDEVYSQYKTIQKCIDQKTWSRFVKARKSIVDASNSYINAVAAGQIGAIFTAGALSVPTLSIRNTAAAAEIFKNRYITIHNDYGREIGTFTDASQIRWIGQNLINVINSDYKNLVESIKWTPNRSARSPRIDKDLEQINEQLGTVLNLKPGTQKKLNDMPPKAEFKSDNKNLMAQQAFMKLSETIDGEWYAVGEYASALHWYGWKRARELFDLSQTHFRDEVLNNQVLPVYRKIVGDVYPLRNTIKNCVDEKTWSRFEDAQKNIVKASDGYKKSFETREKCQ